MSDPGGRFRVGEQFPAKEFGYPFAGQVITGWPQTASGHHDVGPRQGFANRRFNGFAGVRDGDLPGDLVARIAEPPAEPLQVRIEDSAQQQLGPRVDQFNVHWLERTGERRGQKPK
jgi:hypothetical protein